jgi:predicted Zn-dependent peptidase
VLDLALRAALEPVTADELAEARAALESDLARAGDGPLARARRLGFASVIARNADDGKQYLEAIERAGAAELQQAAAAFLTTRQVTVSVALPDGPPRDATRRPPRWRRAWTRWSQRRPGSRRSTRRRRRPR